MASCAHALAETSQEGYINHGWGEAADALGSQGFEGAPHALWLPIQVTAEQRSLVAQ